MGTVVNLHVPWGTDLTPGDLENLAQRYITPERAEQAGIRRVDSITGAAMFNRKKKNMAGLIIPNVMPGEDRVRDYRIRLDFPDHEYRIDGTVREVNKYLQPPERRSLLYFPPGVHPGLLQDVKLPVIITEGEFKALALWRLALYETTTPRFLPTSVAGVWNFWGTIGKTTGPRGERWDVKGVIPDMERLALKGRPVIIVYDADSTENEKVLAARRKLSSVLIERGAVVGCLEWPISEGKGIDDRLFQVGPEQVLKDIIDVQFGDWRSRLLRNDEGKLLNCYENVSLFLENSPEFAGAIGYNEFTGGLVVLRPLPSPITAQPGVEIEDHFDTELIRWFERKYMRVSPNLVTRAVDAVARRNSFHPIREYLESLIWDGVPRIGTWLIDYCSVESNPETPNLYAMAVGEKFLISAVARIMEPGCKADCLLVLEGDQGDLKSTSTEVLAGKEWWSDQLSDMGSKDASMQLRGVWIMELSELDQLSRVEVSRMKHFISSKDERFRLPYGKRVVKFPRQCVFIGTTNTEEWLKDETGGRRFWPVRVTGKIDTERIARDRDQLWAEAVHKYHAGAKWWLDDAKIVELAVEEQSARYAEDVWQEQVEQHAKSLAARAEGIRKGSVSRSEILYQLGVDLSKQDQIAANRVARCLTRAGWKRKRVGAGADREWRYKPGKGRDE